MSCKGIPKKPHTRPKAQKRTKAMEDRILNAIAFDKTSLYKAARAEGITDGAFIFWCKTDPNLAERYAKAMELRFETLALDIIEIGDNIAATPGYDENGQPYVNNNWVNLAKLRTDNMKWILSKYVPKKFGDRLEVDSNASVTHSGGTVNVNISTDPVQASRDYQDFIKGKK